MPWVLYSPGKASSISTEEEAENALSGQKLWEQK